MLIPQYSLRSTLIGVSCCAVFFLIIGDAFQGQPWAIAVSFAVVSFFGCFLVHAFLFLAAAYFGKMIGTPLAPARTNHGGLQTSSDQQFPPQLKEESEEP